MSAIAERPFRGSQSIPIVERDKSCYRGALLALSRLSRASSEGGDPDQSLRLVASGACEVLSVRRAGIYLRDDERSVFVGRIGHPADEIEAAVQRLTLGGPADEITGEILSTGEPVAIADAYADSRASRAAIRAWKVRSLLAVPILAAEEAIGILVLDDAESPRCWSRVEIEIACAFAAVASSAIRGAQELCRLRAQLETAHRQNRLLRAARTADHRLSEAVLSGGGLSAIVGVVSEVTGKPAVLYGADGRSLAGARASEAGQEPSIRLLEDADGDERVMGPLRDALAGGSVCIEPLLEAGIRRRHLAVPIDVAGERSGWLVVMEHRSRLTSFDEFVLRRAATHVALELAGRRTSSASQADARASLARQLLRGTSADEDVRRDAEQLCIDLDAPRAVVYVTARGGAEGDAAKLNAERLAEELRARVEGDVLASKGPEGVALLVELPDGGPRSAIHSLKRAVLEALEAVVDRVEVLAGISAICRDPIRLPGAYREARDMANCMQSFPSSSPRRLLAADDLGPGRLLIAGANAASIGQFIEDVIGRLLVDEETTGELLRTLEAFYDTGRSVRLASERLGVHENTIRYRLSRVQSITELDVAGDPDDQLSVQVALLGLRLQGHPTLRPLESDMLAATIQDVGGS
jgi:sugar diacid utilization regulator